MAYQNPIITEDTAFKHKDFYISFHFDKYMSDEEALESFNQMLAENGGKLPQRWLRCGKVKQDTRGE